MYATTSENNIKSGWKNYKYYEHNTTTHIFYWSLPEDFFFLQKVFQSVRILHRARLQVVGNTKTDKRDLVMWFSPFSPSSPNVICLKSILGIHECEGICPA